ncbi:MAG: molecular chaperone [Betaproteobacteria bacterium]|nr:molecular chaperone [Betaproteobacteria bacterium]
MNTYAPRHSRFRPSALALLGALAGSIAVPAVAGVFSVTPVRIFMTPKDRAIAVTLSNEGDQPVALQAELNVWSQGADGADVLTPTDDLVLSPPIIKLAPKARQVVRLASLKPADASRQLTYRLIVREIPEAATPGKSIQVPVALALSMPVFITPPPAARKVGCTATAKGSEVLAVCKNDGTAYAQVREAVLKRDGAEARFEGGAYILPGAARTLALKSDKPFAKGAAQLAVTFDDGKSQSFDVMLP